MQFLKQSTGVDVRVGPAMDPADGVTPVTGLTLGAADQAELLKHDGAATVDISGRTFAAVTGSDGWYDLTLTTTDTNTVGMVTVVVQDASATLPTFTDFMVLPAGVYDVLFANVEGTLDLQEVLRLILAAVAGLTTDGGIKFRDVADTKDRIVATVDGSGNRSTIALDGS